MVQRALLQSPIPTSETRAPPFVGWLVGTKVAVLACMGHHPASAAVPVTAQPSEGTDTRGGRVWRRLPVGSEVLPSGVHFRVWAPKCRIVEVIAETASEQALAPFALSSEGDGYFSGLSSFARGGHALPLPARRATDAFPDPASRFQPEGPHGPSQVDRPARVRLDATTTGTGVELEGQVIYEMHVGTFTREGTWDAASAQLPELLDAGHHARSR